MSALGEKYVRWREEHDTGDASRGLRLIVRAVLLLVAAYVAVHVVPALVAKDSPPLACQVMGGHWTLWSGWQCQ